MRLTRDEPLGTMSHTDGRQYDVAHIVGAKGQVVIEKEIRDRLGVGPGWQCVQTVVTDHMEMRFVPPEHDRSAFGRLAQFVKRRPPTDEEMDEAVSRGIAGEWSEREGCCAVSNHAAGDARLHVRPALSYRRD